MNRNVPTRGAFFQSCCQCRNQCYNPASRKMPRERSMKPPSLVTSKRLKQLSQRLVNITRANKSIRLLKQTSRQCIDLCALDSIAEGTSIDILMRVMKGKPGTALSWKDAPRLLQRDTSQLFIDDDGRLEEEETPDSKLVKLFTKLARNLTELARRARAIEDETGGSELYLGYPWLIGNCADADRTFLQAPLILFPVKIEVQSRPHREWLVRPIDNAEPIFNEALVLALAQYHQAKLPEDFIDKAEGAAESKEAGEHPAWLAQRLHQELINVGVKLTLDTAPLSKLPQFKAGEIPMNHEFTLRSHAVVGYFPQADSALRYDYERLMEMATPEQPLDELVDALLDSERSLEPIGNGPVTMDQAREEDTCWIIDTDSSQERALLRSRNEACLVVHGPPGTGKSQVICNLISDALFKGERVLVCCQKRAALDVVFQRLEKHGLGRHVALVHDHSNDRAALYKRIATVLEGDAAVSVDAEASKRLATTIDESTNKLRAIAEELHKPRRCGLTARRLYTLAPSNAAETDPELVKAARGFNKNSMEQTGDVLARLERLERALGPHAGVWSGRNSFADLTFADKPAIERTLVALSQCATALRETGRVVGDSRPLASAAAPLAEALMALSTMLTQPGAADPLASRLDEPGHTGTLLKGMKEIERLMPVLRELPPRPPAEEGTGAELEVALALDIYNKRRSGLLRFLSGAWHRAKATTTQWMARRGLPDTPELVTHEAGLIRASVHWRELDTAVANGPLAILVLECADFAALQALHARAKSAIAQIDRIMGARKAAQPLQEWLSSPGNLAGEAARASALAKLGDAYSNAARAIDALKPWLGERARAVLLEFAGRADQDFVGLADKLASGLADFDSLQAIDDARESLTDAGRAVHSHLRKLEPTKGYRALLEASLYFGWLAEVEREAHALRQVGDGLNSLVGTFREMLKQKRELNQKVLAAKLHQRALAVGGSKSWRDLKHQVGKKRQLWSLRRLVENLRQPLLETMPCWLTSPETLSASFPLDTALFDLVIFDEASQMAVQHCIPALYRARRVVIAGDDQQLRPYDLFGAQGGHEDDEDQAARHEEEDAGIDTAATDSESVLTLAKTRFPEELLNCHYRSKYEELIQFSNHGFYKGRLVTVPPSMASPLPPIEWRKVSGLWEQRRNRSEAGHVLELLYDQLKTHGPARTFGIITFNSTQQQEIEDQIERRSLVDPEFAEVVQLARNPASGDKDAALFVKNIENVQGDERDIIIFSVGYAPDANGRVRMHFGSLSTEGGENRLNVAVSRSREKIYVISSIEPEELNVSTAKNRGSRLLRQYLEYAKAVSTASNDGQAAVLRGINTDVDVRPGDTDPHFESEFEEQVAQALEREGLVVRPQVGVSGYRIDLGIVDAADPTRFLLGIECDGASYHSARDVRERDAYRQRFLESRGWRIHRIWSRNWWQNPRREVEAVLRLVRGRGGEP